MKKLLIATALLFTALPLTFDGVTPSLSKAHAIVGRPLTPFSVAVHRHAVRAWGGWGLRPGCGGGPRPWVDFYPGGGRGWRRW